MSKPIGVSRMPVQEFRCPKCCGRYFGSTGLVDGRPEWGNCQENATGCGFRWKRAEDWRYFSIAGRTYPSGDAYETALKSAVEAANLPTTTRCETGPEDIAGIMKDARLSAQRTYPFLPCVNQCGNLVHVTHGITCPLCNSLTALGLLKDGKPAR